MPWLRYIKLYVEKGDTVFFPIGQFQDYLNNTLPLGDADKITFNKTYRPEQQWIINNVGKTGLIVMKTGKGKSNTALGIVERFQERTLICCHSTTWLTQMVETFKEYADYEVGTWYGKEKKLKPITITTHKSLVQQYKKFKEYGFGIVIIDECDRNLSQDMLKALIGVDPTKLYGMTGTPQRAELDSNDMSLVFWPLTQMPDQENNGYIMIPTINRLLSYESKYFSFTDWHDLRKQMINDPSRTEKQCNYIVDLWEKGKFKHWLLLLLFRETESEHYYTTLKDLLPCYLIHWKTNKKHDAECKEQFATTWWLIIGTTGKLGRWLDIPFLDSVFLFYPNRFKSDTIQSVGRVLRLDERKQAPVVYDWCDMPILKGQAQERLLTYKKEYGQDVVIINEQL